MMMRETFKKSTKSKYNSIPLILVFNAAGVLAGSAIVSDPMYLAIAGGIGGVIGIGAGRLIDGFSTVKTEHLSDDLLLDRK